MKQTRLVLAALAATAALAGAAAPAAVAAGTGPQRHDGAESFRFMRYVPGCTCFQYSGEPFGG